MRHHALAPYRMALAVVACAAAAGCRPSPEQPAEGPMAALASATLSERYDGLYWRQQHRRDSALFARAVGYCRDEEDAGRLDERPNCEAVLAAERFAEGSSRPRLQGRGFTGTLGDAPTSEQATDSSRITADPSGSR